MKIQQPIPKLKALFAFPVQTSDDKKITYTTQNKRGRTLPFRNCLTQTSFAVIRLRIKRVQILETRSLVSSYLLPSGQQDGGGGGRGSFVCGRYNSRFTTRQTRSLTTGHKKNEEGEEGGRQQQMPKSDFPSYFFSPPLLHNPDRASLPGGRVRGGTGVNHRRREYKNTKRKIVK